MATRVCARRGFTLFELMIAMSLGMVVAATALYSYLAANKSQAITVGGNMLKVSGQTTMSTIYRELNGARRLYDRPTSATSDTGKFLNLLPIDGYNGGAAGGLTPGVVLSPISDMILPQIQVTGSFASQAMDASGAAVTDNPNFNQGAVGNALFFLSKDPKVVIDETIAPGVSTAQTTTFGNPRFFIRSYRFQFYFLARRPLPLNAPTVRSDVNWTYQLMHWESLPYLDKQDLEAWMNALYGALGNTSFIDAKLGKLITAYGGAVDPTQDDPDTAMFQLVKNSSADPTHLKAAVTGTALVSGTFGHAVKSQMRSTFGDSFVAFNTDGPPTPVVPLVPIRSLNTADNTFRVPNYGDNTTGVPYGFETMIVGPANSRKVLLHLTLAARTQPGNVLMGDSFQQIAQMYDY